MKSLIKASKLFEHNYHAIYIQEFSLGLYMRRRIQMKVQAQMYSVVTSGKNILLARRQAPIWADHKP